MEIWDAYDETFKKIDNIQLIRNEAIPKGMYHLGTDIIVQHKDGTYLLMQRDLRKRLGGLWELSAGGSALQKESALECAQRELREETGMDSNQFYEIGRSIDQNHQTLYVTYLCLTDCLKDSILLQDGETMDYKWVEKEYLFTNKDIVPERTIEIIRSYCK